MYFVFAGFKKLFFNFVQLSYNPPRFFIISVANLWVFFGVIGFE